MILFYLMVFYSVVAIIFIAIGLVEMVKSHNYKEPDSLIMSFVFIGVSFVFIVRAVNLFNIINFST